MKTLLLLLVALAIPALARAEGELQIGELAFSTFTQKPSKSSKP